MVPAGQMKVKCGLYVADPWYEARSQTANTVGAAASIVDAYMYVYLFTYFIYLLIFP
jgi:hypothetical protein